MLMQQLNQVRQEKSALAADNARLRREREDLEELLGMLTDRGGGRQDDDEMLASEDT